MMNNFPRDELHAQLMVVGAGMAGMSAALFAVDHGISTMQAGLTSEIIYASGLIDLLGVHPTLTGKLWDNPWKGLTQLQKDIPRHPYAHLELDQIRCAIDRLTEFLADTGLPYCGHCNRNVRLIMPVGTIKRTYRVPHSMWAGAAALQEKAPCLVVGIDGLRGFSSGQIVQTLKVKWPALRDATIDLPGNARQGPKYAEHMARALELPQARKQLADMISPHLGNVRYVGLPAILGVHHSVEAIRDLTKMLGVSVFEIPTMPPAITGLRLKEAFDNYLPKLGVKTFYHYKVLSVTRRKDGIFTIIIGRSEPEKTIIAENLLLASGRFLGKGLTAGRDGIHETLLDLPVAQPTHRSQWHHESFLAPGGHALNQAGVEVDRRFRPQTTDGVPVYANLYAAGSILAHQDWMRSKSGVGLAAATAFGAVSAIAKTYAPGSLKNASLIPKTAYTPST